MASQQTLKQIIKEEYSKCIKDPAYFMRRYCMIQHPTRGKIPFDLYNFQEDVLDDFQTERYNVILKARQLGLSTLTGGYSLWLMLFHADKNILVIATKQEVAKNLVTKVRVMHDNLPSWLKGKCIEDNKLSLRFANGSQCKAVSSSVDAGRSEALSLLILDEAAFIDKVEEIWTASQQTLATGGGAIILSTPNGVGNFFHKTWMEAEAGINGFNTIKSKLKDEYNHVNKKDLQQLRINGENITEITREPELLYFCDSNIDNFRNHDEWKKYPVIMCECTSYPETLNEESTYNNGHTHWDQLFPIMKEYHNKQWILLHASMAMKSENLIKYEKIAIDNNIDCFIWK